MIKKLPIIIYTDKMTIRSRLIVDIHNSMCDIPWPKWEPADCKDGGGRSFPDWTISHCKHCKYKLI